MRATDQDWTHDRGSKLCLHSADLSADNALKCFSSSSPSATIFHVIRNISQSELLITGVISTSRWFWARLTSFICQGRRPYLPGLLHIEFQSYDDPEMEMRLLEYNVLASRQNGHWPVYSYVIYLRKAREVAISPLVRTFPDGEEVHRFFFRVIKLWEVPAELLLQTGWTGVLPLVTLTDGGKRPEVVKEMIDRLVLAEEHDLLAISQVIGGLVFKKGPELEWFRKRFSMFQDILRESWVYQELIEQGREEEHQRRIQEHRTILMRFIQLNFPELEALAKQQADGIKDPDVLSSMNINLLAAQRVEEARQILLSNNNGQAKH